MTSTWILFFFLRGASTMNSIGPFNSMEDCKGVEKQIAQLFDPQKRACVQVPVFKQGAQQ